MPRRENDPLADLRGWYADNARELPWRKPGVSAWAVLVSEVMLQQTPVARVLPVYQEWVQRWPEPAALAAVPAGEALRVWGRLGYPRRALRLHQAAMVCVEQYGGALPGDYEQLLALPGVGKYTAAAVAAFAFGQRVPVIDTNVRRVVTRWSLGLPSALSLAGECVDQLLPDAPADAVVTSVALMELGALVCVSRSPRCDRCPISGRCCWLAAGSPSEQELGIAARRSQRYEGTDRQARGRLLAVLRSAASAVPGPALLQACPDAEQGARALAGLVADGLVVATADGYRLP